MDKDSYFINETFNLAKRAEGLTSPNPLVGALIVKNNKIITSGYHKKCGLAHAEIEAFKKAKGKDFKGATLYLNLEPCFSFGRTPPCVDEIIRRRFKRVVIATPDPNPQTKGKSIRKLKKAGIRVSIGLLASEAQKLNEVFFKNMQKKHPFVVAKVAQSLDGKIATRNGASKWITTEGARKFAKQLRDKYDCVCVGVNTVIDDNPSLNGLKRKPLKVIIDPNLRIPLNSNLLKEKPAKTIIFTSSKSKKKAKRIPWTTKIFFLKENKGWLPLRQILKILYNLGVTSIFVEGGSQTIGRFFDEKLIDKAYFFIAPKIIGGKRALTSVGAQGFSDPNKAPSLKEVQIKHIGKDMVVSGYPVYT
jgi:diaminohydroxyphosphoribosylaminopyrimidine deaminase/5-amino-6-(5-phosphoribosylamino)uracil reductase